MPTYSEDDRTIRIDRDNYPMVVPPFVPFAASLSDLGQSHRYLYPPHPQVQEDRFLKQWM
eukprot:960351-Pyramimonas_sp.AAC.1